tara:strand:+ start:3800 stop:4003 length:204 start_codon:yes stop_codon:yes gene_type:complete
MMVNYIVENNSVVETQTEYVVKDNMDPKEAKALARYLNFGGGFDGRTPSFFQQKSKDIVFDDESFYK